MNGAAIYTKSSCNDIEDMLKLGTQNNICPYYLSKSKLA